jgi:hypothetical protein
VPATLLLFNALPDLVRTATLGLGLVAGGRIVDLFSAPVQVTYGWLIFGFLLALAGLNSLGNYLAAIRADLATIKSRLPRAPGDENDEDDDLDN